MAILSPRSRAKGDIPTSSMADIAFLLLIFFLVTTVFPNDRGLALVLPENVEVPIPAQNVLHFVIDATGLVEVRHGDSPQVQNVEAPAVRAIWRQAAAENASLIAAVKTHEDAAYYHLVEVLDELSAAGAERISLQMTPN